MKFNNFSLQGVENQYNRGLNETNIYFLKSFYSRLAFFVKLKSLRWFIIITFFFIFNYLFQIRMQNKLRLVSILEKKIDILYLGDNFN